MTTYTPLHPSGHRGPTFDSATAACLWIVMQRNPGEWTWETLP